MVLEKSAASTMKLNYDGHNGHPYTSIGRILIQEHGLSIADVSMEKIKKWIENNPNLGNDLMERNKSFVFFKISENSKRGPTGSIGYPLTPLRSIAIDPMKNPMGFLYFISTEDSKYHKIQKFVFGLVAQIVWISQLIQVRFQKFSLQKTTKQHAVGSWWARLATSQFVSL